MAQRRVRYGINRVRRRLGLSAGKSVAAVLVAVGCLAGGAGALGRLHDGGVIIERATAASADGGTTSDELAQPAEAGDVLDAEQEVQGYVVHVDGAVGAPGVIHVEGADVRVYDAVEAAGGLLPDADTTSVNLAESLVDGAKIHIPREGELASDGEQVLPAGQASTSGATGAGEATALVNINTAGAEELQTLSGIGEVTAQAIIDEREGNGPFASIEDLMRVSGIGEKKFERIRGQICV